jgi:hypothetical protein
LDALALWRLGPAGQGGGHRSQYTAPLAVHHDRRVNLAAHAETLDHAAWLVRALVDLPMQVRDARLG